MRIPCIVGLVILAAWRVEAAVQELDGYVHVYGECANYATHTYRSTSYTKTWCKSQCDAYLYCAGFLYMDTRNKHKKLAGSQGCILSLRVCEKKEYIHHTTSHHTYIKIGHKGMIAPGFNRYSGECRGVDYKLKANNLNSVSCAAHCIADKTCKSFFLSSTRQCKLGKDSCNGQANKMTRADGYTFVMTGRNLAYKKTTTGASYQSVNYYQNAVDGWRDGFMKRKSCYLSPNTGNVPWWKVTLGAYYPVKQILITNRADCCSDKNFDFNIYVRDEHSNPKETLCARQMNKFVGTYTAECQDYILGTSVVIRMNDRGMKRELALCEVEVYEQPKVDALDMYEIERNKYCGGNVVRATQVTKTPEECARICDKMAECSAFQRYSTTCAFMSGCPEVNRHTSASYTLWTRQMHSVFDYSGFSHTQGRCTSFKTDIKTYYSKSIFDCLDRCNQKENCETVQYLSHASTPNSGTCYLSSKAICDNPTTTQYYHIYEKAMVNVAFRRQAYQSSTFGSNVASRAVDGILGLFMSLNTCSKTEPSKHAWWAVDLQFNTRVKKVYVNTLRRGVLFGLKVVVSNNKPREGHDLKYVKTEICETLTRAVTKRANFNCRRSTGRYLSVVQDNPKPTSLIICEVSIVGYKNFDVHGYTENDGSCAQNQIEIKKGLTPGDCADLCNKVSYCAAFEWWLDTSEIMNCVTKASDCKGHLTNKGKTNPKYRLYSKDGHPGLSIAGFERKQFGYYTTGYSLKTMHYIKAATPAMCARECNLRANCHGITFGWTTYPVCYVQSKWPATTKFVANKAYTSFIRKEPNIGVGRKTMGVGRFLEGAVDGNTAGIVAHQSCFISTPVKGMSWWALDFEKPHYVNSIKIWNRADCCNEQLKQIVAVVSDNKPPGDHDPTEVCAEYEKPTTKKGGILKLNCRYPIAGQFLIIKKEGNEPLVMCEVAVNGQIWTDKNVALKKKTDSSGDLGNSASSKAVDGKINTNVGTDTCAATRPSSNGQATWLSVDLGKVNLISAIKIHSRSDCCRQNLADFTVSVSTSKPRWNYEPQTLDICNVKKGAVELNTMWSMRCRDPPIGQYVIVSQENEGESLTVCEVEIYGKEMNLAEALGFWPLTGGLKGKGVKNGVDGTLRNAISRPGPLDQPYTAFTFQGGKSPGLSIMADKKIRFKTSFTVMAYIQQETAVKDGSIIKWHEGQDLNFAIKNERLSVHAVGRMDDVNIVSKHKLFPDRWHFVVMSFDSKKAMFRLFVDDQETEQKVQKGFRVVSVINDDIAVGHGGFRGGVSCVQIYNIPMTLVDVIAARSRCKHYLKQPGDRAENILKGMKATQSSTWKDNKASLAVDGDDAPYMWRKSCASTAPDPTNKIGPHWWAVQMSLLRLITSVKLTNRMDCCADRLRDFRILVTTDKPNSPLGYDPIDVCTYHPQSLKPGQSKTFTCRAGGLVGQYVVVTKSDPTPLTLCEVEAYGDKVSPQPKRNQLFIWRSRRIDSLRRSEKKMVNEIASLKLCQRECMKESGFECRAVEYENDRKRCRLFDNGRDIKFDKTAENAAFAGTFVSQAKKGKTPPPKPKPAKELMKDLASLKMALQKVEKTRTLLIKTGQQRSKVFNLIVHRIESYKKGIKEMTSGSPKKLANPKGRNDLESVSRSPSIYSEWGSYDPVSKKRKCARGLIRRWQTSTNWVLNVPSDKVYDGVRRMEQCESICLDEVEFLCLSFAFNADLSVCHLWAANTAQPGLDLIQTSGFTYNQWGCGSKPEMCTCTGSGDPHMGAFSKRYMTHTGNCKYLATKSIDESNYCNFRIENKNIRYYVIITDVYLFGHRFRINMNSVNGLKRGLIIDGRHYDDLSAANRVHPHVAVTSTSISSERCQIWVVATAGGMNIQIGKPYWQNRVEGWCGNCPTGGSVFDFTKYEVVDDSNIGSMGQTCMAAKKPTGPCQGAWTTKVSKPEYCGYFKDYSGPFGTCLRESRVRAANRYNDCKFDVCTFGKESEGGARGQACTALGNLAEACAQFGKPIKAWRSADFCPIDCGSNMEYQISTSGCPASCVDPEAPKNCDMKPREGCACKAGYVLNEQRKCVVREMCTPRSLADIVFLIDMSERMGPKLAARARDLVAEIVDTIDISEKTTQVSVVPYCYTVWQAKLYHQYKMNRPELVEAIRNIPFCGGASRLPLALRYVRTDILNPSLERLRPSDQYMKFVVIVTSSDVADDDAVVEQTQYFIRSQGKVIWIKYDSQTKPDPKGLTIDEYVLPITDPKNVDELVDTFNYRVFKETKCGLGFYSKRTKVDEACRDIDECEMDVCSKGSTCKNTKGSYKCECPKGFCFKAQYGCEEINECYRNPCLPGSSCKNTIGAYTCLCPKGYRYDSKKSCVDVNECVVNKNLCKKGSQCVNSEGSYVCKCKPGYVYKKDVGCATNDVCLAKKPCKGIAKCENVNIKGYLCTCPIGFISDKRNGCTKIDLCKKKPCKGDLSTCMMDKEKFICMCPENFQYDKSAGCERLDPCLSKPCRGYAKCTSENGQFYCGCPGSMYYNEKVGCEEPEIRVPKTKLVIILDDSDAVGKKDFKVLKDSVTKIVLAMADNNKKMDVGVILMGGKAELVVPIRERPVYDYDEIIQDIAYNGGKLNFPDALNLLKTNKDVLKKDYGQLTIAIITKANKPFSKSLNAVCKQISTKSGSGCHHMVLLYGPHRTIVDTTPSVILIVPTVVELYTIEYFVTSTTKIWMTCPLGYVISGANCRQTKSVMYTCPFDTSIDGTPGGVQHFAAETVFTYRCVTYKCLPGGEVKPINAQCVGSTGQCFAADGVTKFSCLSNGKVRDECTCTVKVTPKGLNYRYEIIRDLLPSRPAIPTYGGTAMGVKCHFPFRSKGRVYTDCTDANSDIPWCATTEDMDQDDKWGYCKAGKDQGKCMYDRREYLQGQVETDENTCVTRTCTKDGTMKEKKNTCRTLDNRCVPIGTRDYPCDEGGRRYETCKCVGNNGHPRNVAYTYTETVGDKTLNNEICIYEGKHFPMGKPFSVGCDRFKCEEGKTMDVTAKVAYANPVWIDGDCEHTDPDGKQVCVPVNKTMPCTKDSLGKKIECTCSKDEDDMYHLRVHGLGARRR